MSPKYLVAASLSVGFALPAFAQAPIVDGVRDAEYGAAISVQNTTTGFGDSNLGAVDFANGSELDNCHAMISGGVLYLFFGGNLETNWNKFELFLDSAVGGQNQLRGDNPDVDFQGLNRIGSTGAGDGLLFDECFTANAYFTITAGASPVQIHANLAQILTDGGGTGLYLGGGAPGTAPIVNVETGVTAALNNSNIAGVGGDGGSTDGAGVATGIEVAIPLSLLGYDGASQANIKITAAINGSGHDWFSNQFVAPVNWMGNFGEPRLLSLAGVAGNQYAVVVVDASEPDCPVDPPACPADLNGDTIVDGLDMTALLSCWDTPCGDVDGDGVAGGLDLTSILASWGPCP